MDSEFCIEDIIVSIYGTEMLLKQIKERQIRNCLYNWKYKSQLWKELSIQKKKYNKYMLDGFYALARQTQSICMLFHMIKLIEYKQKRFSMDRLIFNLKESMNNENIIKEESNSVEITELENYSELSSLDENTIMLEFQQNLVRYFHGINTMINIIESKKNKIIYICFYKMRNFKGYEKDEIVINNQIIEIKANKDDKIVGNENSDAKDEFVVPSPIRKSEIHDKENISRNSMRKQLNNGLSLNREELYFEQISEKKQFYTRKQNASFNNGSISKPLERKTSNQSDFTEQRYRSAEFTQQNYSNSNFHGQVGNNVIIGKNIIDFTHANPILFSSIKSPVNSNPVLTIYPAHSPNFNFSNPVINRKYPHFNNNLNYSNQLSSGHTPLNTTKYSRDNLPNTNNSRLNKQYRSESNQNFVIKRYSSNDRKSPRSADIAKSILNPCINFTHDSTNLIQNITDSFKSVILN
ncbi:uncharacterized protein cubi_00312 [Cryptosporidium ubiquitum]|uniref:Uncharacterized protein n=1 Tax=Cryptosporidium ubiquitum TaxID=857276 RepID=A0A1J4ML49_9CRYT|nr:uncharacterized protein cubi_00312 [Cryptosporidium ubiquitum]OII74759.1 hypothetical protein cubi_00312 [Cryptosporidium ubiquitum]